MICLTGAATNTATSKEIWVEPVNRFLGAVSVYESENHRDDPVVQTKKNISVKAETTQTDNGDVTVTLTLSGSGKHTIGIKAYNAETGFNGQGNKPVR